MQKWEYKLVEYVYDGGWTWNDGGISGISLGDKLNKLGEEGWEYVEVRDTEQYVKVYLFKRPRE